MKLAALTVALILTAALLGGLLALGRAGRLRSGLWAVAAVALLAVAYSLDVILRRFT